MEISSRVLSKNRTTSRFCSWRAASWELEVQDVEEDEAFRVESIFSGLELDQVHMKLEDVIGHKRGLKFLQVGGGSWVLHRHTLQRFQSDVEVKSCGQETSYFTVPCRG